MLGSKQLQRFTVEGISLVHALSYANSFRSVITLIGFH